MTTVFDRCGPLAPDSARSTDGMDAAGRRPGVPVSRALLLALAPRPPRAEDSCTDEPAGIARGGRKAATHTRTEHSSVSAASVATLHGLGRMVQLDRMAATLITRAATRKVTAAVALVGNSGAIQVGEQLRAAQRSTLSFQCSGALNRCAIDFLPSSQSQCGSETAVASIAWFSTGSHVVRQCLALRLNRTDGLTTMVCTSSSFDAIATPQQRRLNGSFYALQKLEYQRCG